MTDNPFSALAAIAEQRIQEAAKDGAFDDLPGAGKPLHLEDESLIPEDLRMAFKILKNAGCLPPELEERREMTRLADLLAACPDEGAMLAAAEKARLLLSRAQCRLNRPVRLEEADPCHKILLERLARSRRRGA